MTDFTEADEIAAEFQAAAPLFASAFHPDTYTVVRTVRVNDGYGGMTETEDVVETGQCRLDVSSGGREGVSGNVIESVSSYIVELPRDTDLQASDGLTVNGREFEVVDIRRGGEFDMFTVAGVEERG